MCDEIQKLLAAQCGDKYYLYFLLINEELNNLEC